MVVACGNRGELAPRRIHLPGVVVAPADRSTVSTQPARMDAACGDRGELAPRRIHLPVVVDAPADRRAINAQPARMPNACGNRGELARRRIRLPVVVAAPADHRAVSTQPARMPLACGDRGELARRRIRICAGVCVVGGVVFVGGRRSCWRRVFGCAGFHSAGCRSCTSFDFPGGVAVGLAENDIVIEISDVLCNRDCDSSVGMYLLAGLVEESCGVPQILRYFVFVLVVLVFDGLLNCNSFRRFAIAKRLACLDDAIGDTVSYRQDSFRKSCGPNKEIFEWNRHARVKKIFQWNRRTRIIHQPRQHKSLLATLEHHLEQSLGSFVSSRQDRQVAHIECLDQADQSRYQDRCYVDAVLHDDWGTRPRRTSDIHHDGLDAWHIDLPAVRNPLMGSPIGEILERQVEVLQAMALVAVARFRHNHLSKRPIARSAHREQPIWMSLVAETDRHIAHAPCPLRRLCAAYPVRQVAGPTRRPVNSPTENLADRLGSIPYLAHAHAPDLEHRQPRVTKATEESPLFVNQLLKRAANPPTQIAKPVVDAADDILAAFDDQALGIPKAVAAPAKTLLDPRGHQARPLGDLGCEDAVGDVVADVAGRPGRRVVVPSDEQQAVEFLLAQVAHVPPDRQRLCQLFLDVDMHWRAADLEAERPDRLPDRHLHVGVERADGHVHLDAAAFQRPARGADDILRCHGHVIGRRLLRHRDPRNDCEHSEVFVAQALQQHLRERRRVPPGTGITRHHARQLGHRLLGQARSHALRRVRRHQQVGLQALRYRRTHVRALGEQRRQLRAGHAQTHRRLAQQRLGRHRRLRAPRGVAGHAVRRRRIKPRRGQPTGDHRRPVRAAERPLHRRELLDGAQRNTAAQHRAVHVVALRQRVPVETQLRDAPVRNSTPQRASGALHLTVAQPPARSAAPQTRRGEPRQRTLRVRQGRTRRCRSRGRLRVRRVTVVAQRAARPHQRHRQQRRQQPDSPQRTPTASLPAASAPHDHART